MSVPRSEHKVYIYKDDYNAMCTEVYKHQHIETGGNLFGLWTTTGSAVIHVVLGPGQDCRRTNTSFHQDIEYMHRVGRFVNDSYMLCHIGEWHSHHSLSLSRPSHGDEQTIERNFPKGMSKFLVIIANIKNRDTIVLSPYFFTDGGKRYEKAEYVVLESENPFLKDVEITAEIEMGAERSGHRQNKSSGANHSGAPLRDTGNRRNTGSNSRQDGNASPTRLQANQDPSQVNPSTPNSQVNPSASVSKANPDTSELQGKSNSFDSQGNSSTSEPQATPSSSKPDDQEEPMDTEDSDLYPPIDYEDASASAVNATSASQPNTSAGSQKDTDPTKNNDDGKASELEIRLKKIHDNLKNWFGNQTESLFKFETSKDALEISFKHNHKYYMVSFPKDFPTKPAKLFYSSWQSRASYSECSIFDIVKSLNNEVNILLTIKKICGTCNVCKHFTEESLSRSDLSQHSMEKLFASINKLVIEITENLGVNAVSMAHPLDSSHAEIKFEHANRCWIIDFPAQFPDIPAKVYSLPFEGSSQKHDVLLHGKYWYGPQDLTTIKLIIQAIQSESK